MDENPTGAILIVDDEPAMCEGLEALLAGEGYNVASAGDGIEALAKAAALVPDLVLLDVKMPGLDGFEVCRRLRADPLLAEIPIIMLTTLADHDSRLRGFEAGADDFVSKPFDEIELLTRVRSITRLNRYRRLLQTQAALRESEERFRALFDGAPIGLYRTTPDGRILDANPALVNMLGYPDRESLLATGMTDIYVDIQDRQRWQSLLEREGIVRGFETQLRKYDGTPIWVQENTRVVRDSEGRLLYYEGAVQDITGHRRAEQLLQMLNQTALAIETALTPDEIFAVVANAFKKVGLACILLPTDKSGTRLLTSYMSYESSLIEAVEKLVGLRYEEFSLPIERVEPYKEVVWNRKTVFTEKAEVSVRQALPRPFKKFAGQIARMLKIPKSIAAPLVVGERVVGLLSVQSDTLTERDVPAVTAFAHQVAAAWHRAQLFEQARAHSRYLETLLRINATLRSTLPLDEVLALIARGAAEALDYIGSLILLPDAAGERLILGAVWGSHSFDMAVEVSGMEAGAFSLPLAAAQNPVVQAYLSGEIQAWNGALEQIVAGIEPAISPELILSLARAMGNQGVVCIPLSVGGTAVGVLIVLSPRQQFLEEERAVLMGLADQAGLAIHNARLYQAAQQEIAERKRMENLMRLQRDLSIALGATDNLTEALDQVLETMLRIEGIDSGGIYLLDRSTGELALTIQRGLSPESMAAISHYIADLYKAQPVHGEAVYWQHADAVPVTDSAWRNGELRFVAVVPVRYEGQVIGALNCTSHTYDDIPISARQALETIAGLTGRAIADIQAREALRESEERYRTLFENAPIGIYRATPDGRVLVANPALIQMLGYASFDDLVAASLAQDGFIAGHPRQLFTELVEHAGEITGLEYMWTRRDHSLLFVRESARAHRGSDGAVDYYEGVIEDITVHKRAESALRQSEQRFRNVIQQASDGIALTNERGQIVEWNQAQERITGLKQEDVIGLSLWDAYLRLIPEERKDGSFHEMIRLSQHEFYRTGQAFWLNQPIEYDILRPDGARRIIQVVVFSIQVENGFALGSVTRDITERTRAQYEIERRYRELATLNEMGQAITSTLDLREMLLLVTNHTTRLLGAQAASVLLYDEERDDLCFAAASGLGADFVMGRRLPLGQGIAGWVVERNEPALVPDVSQDPRWFSDFDKGGNFATYSLLCVPLRNKGRVIGALEAINKEGGFGQDDLHLLSALAAPVSAAIENARLFAQVRQGREQLQALSRRLVELQEAERGHIARELHDETGQALSSLLLNLSLLEHAEDCPKKVQERILQMEALVDELLENLHRLAMNLRPAALDHLGLVPTLEQYVETFGEQNAITTRFETVGLGPERLLPDIETAIYRIVQEALTNVLRHAHASRVDVLLERRGDIVVTIVEDDGVGFDADAMLKSGRLGLFGMKERAEMLGGRLVIESAPGAGTTVFVEVPYAHSHPDRR